MQETLRAIPKAGIVGGFHNIPTSNIEESIKSLQGKRHHKLEAGHYIETDTLEELARSLEPMLSTLSKRKKQNQFRKLRISLLQRMSVVLIANFFQNAIV